MSLFEILSLPEFDPTAKLLSVSLATATFFLGGFFQRRTLTAKYRDRLFELNKLTVQSPTVVAEYVSPCNHTGNYFNSTPPTKSPELLAQVRAYVHFRLNFYEEVFYATRPLSGLGIFEEGAIWRSYIKKQLKHSLAQEVLKADQESFGPSFVRFSQS